MAECGPDLAQDLGVQPQHADLACRQAGENEAVKSVILHSTRPHHDDSLLEPGGDRGGDGAKQRQPSELEFVDPHRDVVGVLDEERLLGDNPQSEVLQDRKYVGEHDRISGAVNA